MMKSMVKTGVVLFLLLCFASGAVAGPTIDAIQKKKELVIGTSASYPPLTFRAKDGSVRGLDIDLGRFIASAMKVDLRIEVLPFNDLIPALESGKIDMILSCMTMTPERNMRVAYVGPYFMSGQSVLTTQDVAAKIKGPADLNRPDFSIAVPKGTTSERIAGMIFPDAERVVVRSTDEALEMLLKKKVKSLMADYPFVTVEAIRYRDKGFVANAPFSAEPLGIAVRQDDPLLVNLLGNLLILLKSDQWLDEMGRRWFSDPAWISDLP